jgi:hypothetical protein
MFRYVVSVMAVALLFAASGAQKVQATAPDVPAIVLRASAAFGATLHGIVGMQRHFSTKLSAGPVAHDEESDSGLLMQDGRFAKIAYFRIVRDGRPFSPAQVQQRDDEANREWAAGQVYFKEPYDPRYIADYAFKAPQASCSECSPGSVSVGFTSSIHDSQHGSGTMIVDTNNARVLKLNYTPYVLPPHASSGSVTETGGWGLPDLWYAVRIDEAYRGQMFLVSGAGTFSGVFDTFRRFASLEAGEAALQNQTI